MILSDIKIFINGVELPDLGEIRVIRDLQNLGGQFDITNAITGGAFISPGDFVEIMNYASPIMLGFVMRREKNISKDGGVSYNFFGVDYLGLLNDCQIPKYKTYKNMSVVAIFEAMKSHLLNSGMFVGLELTNKLVDEFQVNMGESIATTVGRLATYTENYVFARGDGVILFTQTNDIKTIAHSITIGVDNVKSISLTENIQGCASIIHGKTHFDPITGKRFPCVVEIPKYPRNLYTPNYITGGDTLADITQICNARKKEIANDCVSLVIEMVGITSSSGKIWELNDNVAVSDSTGKYPDLINTYCVKEFQMTQSKTGGTITRLSLGGVVV